MYQHVRYDRRREEETGIYLFDWLQWVVLLLLFLMAMDFKNRFFYWAFASFGMMALYQRKALQLPKNVIAPIVLAISLSVFAPSTKDSMLGMLRPFTYPFCVIIGYGLLDGRSSNEREKQLWIVWVALASGAFGHYLLNMILNWGADVQRNTIDVWTKVTRAATGQAALACVMVGVACSLLFCRVKKWKKVSACLILASIIAYNFQLAGRSLFIFILFAVFVAFMIRFRLERSNVVRTKMIVSAMVVVFLAIILVSVNAFGIVDKFVESNFYDRFYGEFSESDISEDGRLSKKLNYLKYMLDYPFGGGYIRMINGYAHDIILDTYDEAGLFAMLAVMFMLWGDLHKCLKIYRSHRISNDTKIMLITVLVLIMLQFMLEPVVLGAQWLVASYCVISGTMAKLLEV